VVARGVLFALTADEEAGVLSRAGKQQELVDYVVNSIEEKWDRPWLAETDKTWDAMHRALGDDLFDHEMRTPLHGAILGGRALTNENWYYVVYKSPGQVKDIAIAIAQVSDEAMRERYFAIDQNLYDYDKSEEDCEATVGWFGEVRDFYQRAAAGGRAVIFAVDQ